MYFYMEVRNHIEGIIAVAILVIMEDVFLRERLDKGKIIVDYVAILVIMEDVFLLQLL